MIDSALKTIWISTPYLIPPYRLRMALVSAAKRGVNVKLFVPGVPDKKIPYALAKSEFSYLVKSGVHIYIYTPGFNHEKEMVVDDIFAFCGTINFDFRSLVHHFECGTVLYKCNCMKEIEDDFKTMVSVSEEVPSDFRLRGIKKAVCSLFKIISALF